MSVNKRTRRTVVAAKLPTLRKGAEADSAAEAVATRESDAVRARALKAFREKGTVTAACRAAKVHRQRWHEWVRDDPAFAAEVASAVEDVSDDLEAEAIARAKGGSDRLLQYLLTIRRGNAIPSNVAARLHQTIGLITALVPEPHREALLTKLDDVWRP